MAKEIKKILILYTSIGLGHKSIAQNIGVILEKAGLTIQTEDILEIQKGPLVSVGTSVHAFINRAVPWFWSWLYRSPWFTKATLPYRVRIAARNYQNTKMVIDSFEPDCVITTQTSASAVVAYLKQKNLYNGLFGIAFSDFHMHEYWLYDEADFYLANIEEQKQSMVLLGTDAKKVYVCGMLVPPSKPHNEKAIIKEKFHIPLANKVMLVSSGSLGSKINTQFLSYFSEKKGISCIVVCGKNKKMYSRLLKEFSGTNSIVLGYYTPMDDLYEITDLFVTKPGGLSVAEALAWKLPILISHMLPGQEEFNYEYLQDNGLIMPEPFTLEASAEEELMTGSFKADIQENSNIQKITAKPEVLLQCFTDLSNR